MFKYQTWIVILKHTTWSLLADIAYDSWRGQMILKTTRAVLLYIIWMWKESKALWFSRFVQLLVEVCLCIMHVFGKENINNLTLNSNVFIWVSVT